MPTVPVITVIAVVPMISMSCSFHVPAAGPPVVATPFMEPTAGPEEAACPGFFPMPANPSIGPIAFYPIFIDPDVAGAWRYCANYNRAWRAYFNVNLGSSRKNTAKHGYNKSQ